MHVWRQQQHDIEIMACNVTIVSKTTSSYFNLSLFFTHSCRFLKRCLQCTENMESLSSTTKNRWDECSTAAKMLVECVERYYAERCEVVSWLFLSVTYKIMQERKHKIHYHPKCYKLFAYSQELLSLFQTKGALKFTTLPVSPVANPSLAAVSVTPKIFKVFICLFHSKFRI